MDNITYKTRFKEIFAISTPIIVEQIFISVMGLVNTAMVSSVGTHAISGVAIVDNMSNIVIAIFAALTTGVAIVTARYTGANDMRTASKAGAQSVLMSVLLSLFITLLCLLFQGPIMNLVFNATAADVKQAGASYFFIVNFSLPILAVTQTIFGIIRGSGNTAMPMFISLAMNLFNFLFGYIFIMGIDLPFLKTPSLGVTGAALAISLARATGLGLSVVYILRFSKRIRFDRLSYFKPNVALQKEILGLGVPTSIESTLFQVGRFITQLFISGMGTAAMAANAVGSAIFAFINVPGNAFATGVMILVGQRVGRKQYDDITKTTVFSVLLGMVVMLMVCVTVYPLTGVFISLYNLDGEAAQYFYYLVLTGCIATPIFWSTSFITPAALRASGDVRYTMYTAVASMWIFRIFAGYFFGIVLKWGVVGVWCGMYVDWFVRSILFVQRLLRKKWN